jgi:hypothetical protein
MKKRLLPGVLVALFGIAVGIVDAEARNVPASVGKGPFTEFRLTPDEAPTETEFGRSVAIDGSLVAVGMGGDGAVGAVFLYKHQGTIYVPEAKLAYPDAIPEACTEGPLFETCPEFGRTVAIQGNNVFVGARFAQAGEEIGAGAVYVFRNHGDLWQSEDKIVSPEPEAGDNFGRALAIQGNLLVVTARKTSAEEGAAYVFARSGDNWIHQQTLIASDPKERAYFGQSVDILGDVMAIGARNADPNGAGGFYLFRKSQNGWTQIGKVTPPNGNNDDQFGFAISISGDLIAVGARRADLPGKENAGAAYLYSLKRNSVEFIAKLTAGDASKGDEFGQSIAIAGDVIAVGAWKDDNKRGSIYLFSQMNGQWIQTDRVTATDGVAGDEFGYSLSAFGNRMVTGAHKSDFISADGGAAYVLPLQP